MARVTVRAVGPVTVGDAYVNPSWSTPPVVVGTPPQWDDNSDGTYSEQDTFEDPDVSYVDPAYADLQRGVAVTSNAGIVTVKAYIRYQCLATGMQVPTCSVSYSGATGSLLTSLTPSDTAGSQAPTWLVLSLTETEPGRMQTFLDRVADTVGTLTLRIQPGFLRIIRSRQVRTRIYEAYLVVQTPSNDAPPCRIFPRRDGLGIGAGAAFPPPKSQQRSPGNRGVGYY